jgi:hypothetical protein
MQLSEPSPTAAAGFLTFVKHEQHGCFGGYLLLNPAGRPIEFHCTAPVRPSRAQQILFGPTMDGFLLGEQIGGTLYSKGSVEPAVVCTDDPAALTLRQLVGAPVLLVLGDGPHENDSLPGAAPLATFRMGRNRMAVHSERQSDRDKALGLTHAWGAAFDWSEPFCRIREAIEEAQRTSR